MSRSKSTAPANGIEATAKMRYTRRIAKKLTGPENPNELFFHESNASARLERRNMSLRPRSADRLRTVEHTQPRRRMRLPTTSPLLPRLPADRFPRIMTLKQESEEPKLEENTSFREHAARTELVKENSPILDSSRIGPQTVRLALLS
jgi:hypothetical protein